ncbi:MAG: hypothetical protein K8F91_18505 [Candidatus Obscuribacterales bacterium]|nr:hypothetical protein [Candidatus Obscuribacterales bacterium]
MADTPQLIGIVLCERVLQDVLRRDAVSCINIYNGITAQSFPAVVPLVYAFAQVSTTSTGFEYQFKIIDDGGTEVAMSPVARVEPLPHQYLTHKIISAFSGLKFDKEGGYKIILEVGGQSIGSLPFQVVLLQQQPQEAPVGQ